jgi:hypothetical protein
MTVAVGFSTTNAPISRLIRLVTREPVTHAWILHEAYGSNYVMEASLFAGFRVVSYQWFRKHNQVFHVEPVAERLQFIGVDARARVNRVAEELGDAYDVWNFVGYVLPKLLAFRSPTKLLCTEVMIRYFVPEFCKGLDPERTTAGQLMAALERK